MIRRKCKINIINHFSQTGTVHPTVEGISRQVSSPYPETETSLETARTRDKYECIMILCVLKNNQTEYQIS